MNFWNIIYEWHSGKKDPEKPGTYYVAKNYAGKIVIDTYSWSEYGWNTTGPDNNSSAIEFGSEYWWTPALIVDVKEYTK